MCRSGCLCRVCDSCQTQTWRWETSPWDLGAAVPENLSEGAGEEGGDADAESRRALAQCRVQQRAVVHPAWMAVLGSACAQGDSAQPAAGQLSHGQKLAMSSQGLEWEPNQLPKSCPGCLTRAC